MQPNGTRHFIRVHFPDEALTPPAGIWVDEYDRLIQVPKIWREWRGAPLTELRKALAGQGIRFEETSRYM
jgi:hypothetical protein